MSILITTDLHLTDKPRDEYRFEIFAWLQNTAIDYGVKHVLILGDLTDEKDKHSAVLVNRIVRELSRLSRVVDIWILKGNHDYTERSKPFFGFLSTMSGIHFITHATEVEIQDRLVFFLPHERDPELWRKQLKRCKRVDLLLMHQTLNGAYASTGFELSGVAPSVLQKVKARIMLSGDVHVPQQLGKLEYVGSPYHVHFGDEYKPHVLLLDGEDRQYLKFPAPSKRTMNVSSLAELKVKRFIPGDQIKIRLQLPQDEFTLWSKRRKQILDWCKDLGVHVHSLEILPIYPEMKKSKRAKFTARSPRRLLRDFCQHENLGKDLYKVGRNLLKERSDG